jgi:hypothetical protein
MSNFEQLKREGIIQRGRKPQSGTRQNSEKYKIRTEARRRASLVLQHRHMEEFQALVEEELASFNDS